MKKTWISTAHQGFVLPGMCPNTLSAFRLAAKKGADMIETDARMTSDGVLIANHDPIVRGFDAKGNAVEYIISETDAATITSVILAPDDPNGIQTVPTLESVLHLSYFTGLRVNIDLKEGEKNAMNIARLVLRMGMRGRCVYATNGSGAETINRILTLDPQARFIDTPKNYTAENLAYVKDYRAKCYAYTGDFSDENIGRIRENGCMLATISLNPERAPEAFRHHPEMAEYLHTSDFEAIDRCVLENWQ